MGDQGGRRGYRRYSGVVRCSIVHPPRHVRSLVRLSASRCCSSFEPLSLSLFLCVSPLLLPPFRPPLFFSLSHLHRALRTCLRAMTRAIEYPTFVLSSLISSFSPGSLSSRASGSPNLSRATSAFPDFTVTAYLALANKRERKRSISE